MPKLHFDMIMQSPLPESTDDGAKNSKKKKKKKAAEEEKEGKVGDQAEKMEDDDPLPLTFPNTIQGFGYDFNECKHAQPHLLTAVSAL